MSETIAGVEVFTTQELEKAIRSKGFDDERAQRIRLAYRKKVLALRAQEASGLDKQFVRGLVSDAPTALAGIGDAVLNFGARKLTGQEQSFLPENLLSAGSSAAVQLPGLADRFAGRGGRASSSCLEADSHRHTGSPLWWA